MPTGNDSSDSAPSMSALDEDEFRAQLAAGQRLRSGSRIQAGRLHALKKSSNEKFTFPIELRHVVIEGDLDMSHCVFERRVVLDDCEFTGNVDLSFCTFLGPLSMTGARFAGRFTMKSSDIRSDLLAGRSRVAGVSNFFGTSVSGDAILRGVVFGASSTFSRLRVGGRLDLACYQGEPTRFEADATFHDVTVLGIAQFAGAQFKR
jgi:hypothetical protein